ARSVARRGGLVHSARAESRAEQSVVPRQPRLGVRAAGKTRSCRPAPVDCCREAAEELGHPGSSRRSAAEAEPPRRRDRRLAEGARRRHGHSRSKQNSKEDRQCSKVAIGRWRRHRQLRNYTTPNSQSTPKSGTPKTSKLRNPKG